MLDLQNNRVLACEKCFGFHRDVNAKESRLYEIATSLESHMFTVTFETQSVLIIGRIIGGHLVCSS